MSFSKIIEYLKAKKVEKNNQTVSGGTFNNDYPDFQTYMEHIQELEPIPEKHLKTIVEEKRPNEVVVNNNLIDEKNDDVANVDTSGNIVSEININDMAGGDIQETAN